MDFSAFSPRKGGLKKNVDAHVYSDPHGFRFSRWFPFKRQLERVPPNKVEMATCVKPSCWFPLRGGQGLLDMLQLTLDGREEVGGLQEINPQDPSDFACGVLWIADDGYLYFEQPSQTCFGPKRKGAGLNGLTANHGMAEK